MTGGTDRCTSKCEGIECAKVVPATGLAIHCHVGRISRRMDRTYLGIELCYMCLKPYQDVALLCVRFLKGIMCGRQRPKLPHQAFDVLFFALVKSSLRSAILSTSALQQQNWLSVSSSDSMTSKGFLSLSLRKRTVGSHNLPTLHNLRACPLLLMIPKMVRERTSSRASPHTQNRSFLQCYLAFDAA